MQVVRCTSKFHHPLCRPFWRCNWLPPTKLVCSALCHLIATTQVGSLAVAEKRTKKQITKTAKFSYCPTFNKNFPKKSNQPKASQRLPWNFVLALFEMCLAWKSGPKLLLLLHLLRPQKPQSPIPRSSCNSGWLPDCLLILSALWVFGCRRFCCCCSCRFDWSF